VSGNEHGPSPFGAFPPSQRGPLLILAAAVMVAGMLGYVRGVAVPAETSAVRNSPAGNLSGLYPQWLGARELLLHGRDPYSQEVTQEIQEGVWGHRLDARNPNDPKDEARFAYPLYVVFLLAPTVGLPFPYVQVLYVTIAIALSVASVWFWLRFFGHGRSLLLRAVSSILFVGSYGSLTGLHLQQLTLVVAALIAVTLAYVATDRLWLAGITLALGTIKPQLTVALVAWLLLWAFAKWQERKILFLSFTATMGVMFAGAELLLPGWIWEWQQTLSAYMRYAPLAPTHLQLALGTSAGNMAGAAVVLAIAVFCWRIRREPATSDRFKFVPALMLAAYLVISPVWHFYDYVLLLPGVLLALHWQNDFYRMRPSERAFVSISAIVLAWQWISTTGLWMTAMVLPGWALRGQVLLTLSMAFAPGMIVLSLILMARSRFSAPRLEHFSKIEL